MSATPFATPVGFAIHGGSSLAQDPVKARVAAPRQITHFETLQASPAAAHSLGLQGVPSIERRRLHPGDIVYWIACLGGACLLLLCATT